LTAQSADERFKELYDVERHVMATDGGILVEDPYPDFHRLLAEAPVHEGTIRELIGYGPNMYREHLFKGVPFFSAFSFEANDIVLRDNDTFSSKFYEGFTTAMFGHTILEMVGEEHRRYRALVQPAFTPRRAQWWIDRWIETLVDETVSAFEGRGHAELNAELCSRIPLQTITASFGLTQEQALDFREQAEAVSGDLEAAQERAARAAALLASVIADRRKNPQDDLITMLVEAELEEDGERHLLNDEEVLGFARLILTAGSGTTWRQLGILLLGLLNNPQALAAVKEDRGHMLRRAIDESVRWEPTDPVFRRLVTRDVNLCGVDIPEGAIVEMNLGAANRDPERWDHPDEFDPFRPAQSNLGFAGGPHVCLGMHVARAEMVVAMNHVLDRLPDIRWDPEAPPARLIGLEHRGPNGIPVIWG
jgi:cytochrome P450